MANKQYSNKGVNATLREQEAAAAAQQSKKQTMVISIVAIALVILAVTLAIAMGGQQAPGKNENGTTPSTQAPTTSVDVDMNAIEAEIDSMRVDDFQETDQMTSYVKISIKDHGDVIVRLREDIAPQTVRNFQDLVSKKFYDGLTFHRIRKGFMIQGGDPKGDGTGGSDKTIVGEFAVNGFKNDLSHITGVISMARRSSPLNSATSQFFIVNSDSAARSLDGSYAGFGYVVAGLNVVLAVSDVEVKASATGEMATPVTPVVIESIRFVTKK